MRRGVYRVTATRGQNAGTDRSESKLWEVPIAVNGPADESDLGSLDSAPSGGARDKAEQTTLLEASQSGTVAFAGLQGNDLSKWGLAVVLAGLLLELGLLTRFSLAAERTP
jgi:hypothetical protein